MKQACLVEPGKLEIQEQPACPPCGEGEALITIGYVGVCGTDYHAFDGRQNFFTYPRVLGYELGVTVKALGPGTEHLGLAVGDNCAVEPYVGCGKCVACRRGRENCCTNIYVLGVHRDGGLCTEMIVPARKLHTSKTLSVEHLAVVETMCIGAHAVNRATIEKGENVLVCGGGPVGLGVAIFAAGEGAQVIVADIADSKLDFVRDVLKLQTFKIDTGASTETNVEEVAKMFGGELPTAVFDATGSIHSMKAALHYVAHSGKIVFVGHTKEEVAFPNPLFHAREMTVMGSRNAMGSDFKAVIKSAEEGRIDLAPLITHRTNFDGFVEDFMEWKKPETGVIKGLVQVAEAAE